MFAADEAPRLLGDAQQKPLESAVAIGHPQSVFRDQVEDGIDQRPLLGMAVFARDNVGHQLIGRSEDAQRLPRQRSSAVGPGLFQAMFRGSDVIPIQDMIA
jgi:hypothetical protein